jgi:hypothetical protein
VHKKRPAEAPDLQPESAVAALNMVRGLLFPWRDQHVLCCCMRDNFTQQHEETFFTATPCRRYCF